MHNLFSPEMDLSPSDVLNVKLLKFAIPTIVKYSVLPGDSPTVEGSIKMSL